MIRSIEAQAESGRSSVKAVFPDSTKSGQLYTSFEGFSRLDGGRRADAAGKGSALRRYVKYSYETQSCQRLDIDGGCDGKPERR